MFIMLGSNEYLNYYPLNRITLLFSIHAMQSELNLLIKRISRGEFLDIEFISFNKYPIKHFRYVHNFKNLLLFPLADL